MPKLIMFTACAAGGFARYGIVMPESRRAVPGAYAIGLILLVRENVEDPYEADERMADRDTAQAARVATR